MVNLVVSKNFDTENYNIQHVECYKYVILTPICPISYPGSSGFLVAGWSPRETGVAKKKFFFDFPFTVTNLRSGNRRISAVKIPVLPLSKKPADSGYEIAVCRELRSSCSITADTTSRNHLNETYSE